MFMLLLLLLINKDNDQEEDKDVIDIPEADESGTLDNLFDIRLGLIEERYLHLTKENAEPVYFVSAKSFTNIPEKYKINDETKLIELKQVNQLHSDWIDKLDDGTHKTENDKKDRDEFGKILSHKTLIKQKRLLNKEDYLISIRGEPRGYSMFYLEDILKRYNLVYTHYFVRLRPRPNFQFDTEYIHLLLDQITRHKLVAEFRQMLIDKNTKSYASFNSISIDHLRSTEIKYHSDIKIQLKIVERYKIEFDKTQVQNLKFYQLENNIFRSIYTI